MLSPGTMTSLRVSLFAYVIESCIINPWHSKSEQFLLKGAGDLHEINHVYNFLKDIAFLIQIK